MFATIELTPYIQIQGEIARRLPGGRVAIRVHGREYVGAPLTPARSLRLVSSPGDQV
jgi:hypothetical protein